MHFSASLTTTYQYVKILIMNLSKKQASYLKDRGSLSVHKTLSDKISIPTAESTRFKDAKGNLTFGMDICRDGVQEYQAQEIFDADLLKENQITGDTVIRVWRPPNVVFNPAAVKSHNGKPMTRNHPNNWVDAGNRFTLEKGIARDCWYNPQKRVISGTGFVTDPHMVAEIESGEFAEISDGYDSELDFEPGVVPEVISVDSNGELAVGTGMESTMQYPCTDAGTDYDMIMTSYKPNHIAIVPEGRAGNARILDKGAKRMTFMEKLFSKDKDKRLREKIRTMDRATVLRMLADEETDEEKKAALEALAEDECGSVSDAEPEVAPEAEAENITEPEPAPEGGIVEDDLSWLTGDCDVPVQDAPETGGSGPRGMIYGGVDTSFVEEFDTSGAEVDEAVAKENVLTPDGGLSRTTPGIKDANGNPVSIIRELNISISDSGLGTGMDKEVESMKAEELVVLLEPVINKSVNSAINKRLGDASPGDITLDDEDLGVEPDAELEEEPDEYIGDDEAQSIGIAEEWEEPDTELEEPGESEPEEPGETEPEVPGEVEPEAVDAIPEIQGPTPEQFQKWAAGTTDPEAKRMFLALGEKIAGMDAEPEGETPEPEAEPAEGTMDANFMDLEGDMEEDRLEAAAEGKSAPAGPPSNQVSDGEQAGNPTAEQNGYFVPKKLADSQGEVAKLLLDSVDVVNRYGITGIDSKKHAADGTIYHRIIDAAGIADVKKSDDITGNLLNMSIRAIQKNRKMIDGISSLTGKVRDAHASGGFNPGELY